MGTKVLCPSLPDLLRKTVLTFCEGSVKFEQSLEVIGSLHIRSDNERVATFLMDEQLLRSDTEATKARLEQGVQLGEVPFVMTPGDYNSEKSFRSVESEGSKCQPQKKPRKTLKPMRKIDLGYSQFSSDGEGDVHVGYPSAVESEPISRPPSPPPLQPPVEEPGQRNREYGQSNDSVSSDDAYRTAHPQHMPSQKCIKTLKPRITSPLGTVVLEASSTRPDDMLPPGHPSFTSESSEELVKGVSTEDPEETSHWKEPHPLVKAEESPGIKCNEYSMVNRSSAALPTGESIYTVSQSKLYDVERNRVAFVQNYAAAVYEAAYRASIEQNQAAAEQSLEVASSNPAGGAYVEEAKCVQYYRSPVAYSEAALTSVAAMYHSSSTDEVMGIPGMEGQQDDGESWEKAVACRECTRVLKSERMLELHMNTAHTHKTVYPCKQCGKVFYAASSLHSHKKRTHTSIEQKYKCPHCPRCYAFQSELLRHIDTAHTSLCSTGWSSTQWGSQSSTDTQMSSFHSSSLGHSSSQSLSTDRSTELVSQDSQSGTCLPQEPEAPHTSVGPSETDQMTEITDDDQHDQAENPRNARPIKCALGLRFKCNECGMFLKSRECLALHMNAKHTQKQAYPCNVCGRVFYAPSSRFCHMRRVHASKEQKFPCSYCDKVFTFHYELRNHMKLLHRSKLIQRAGGIESSIEPTSLRENGGETNTDFG